MTMQKEPTPQDLSLIEARARALRAQAFADGVSTLGHWLRAHLTFGTAHKA